MCWILGMVQFFFACITLPLCGQQALNAKKHTPFAVVSHRVTILDLRFFGGAGFLDMNPRPFLEKRDQIQRILIFANKNHQKTPNSSQGLEAEIETKEPEKDYNSWQHKAVIFWDRSRNMHSLRPQLSGPRFLFFFDVAQIAVFFSKNLQTLWGLQILTFGKHRHTGILHLEDLRAKKND